MKPTLSKESKEQFDIEEYYKWALKHCCKPITSQFENEDRIVRMLLPYCKRSQKWYMAFMIVSNITQHREKGRAFLEEMRENIIDYFQTPFESRTSKTPLTKAQRRGVLKWQ